MITTKCVNDQCSQFEIEYNFLGEPDRVECGSCATNCDISDVRPDPIEPPRL
jgi:hypothetical protein